MAKFSNLMIESLYGATYEVNFPTDYLHLLNCVCIFHMEKSFKCWDKGSYVQFGATRLTADSWSTIINDFYNRPLPWRPYYYIHHVNKSNDLPTNAYKEDTSLKTLGSGTDLKGYTVTTVNNLSRIVSENNLLINSESGTSLQGETSVGENEVIFPINLARALLTTNDENANTSLVEKEAGVRYGNASTVRCELRCGKDRSVFTLVGVIIDYLKTPQFIRLTQELMDYIEDTSQIMEFPDYVCQEILNELVHLVMENEADPRLQSNLYISTSIAQPGQQLAATQAAQALG